MTTYPWPKTGDKAFAAASDGKFFQLSFIFPGFAGPHAEAFKESADMILAARENESRHYDSFFYPVAYLYRHALELKLKEVIKYGIRLEFLDRSNRLDKLLGAHDLDALWAKAKHVINERWPDDEDNSTKAVEQVIKEFHQADESGQAFRYHRDRDGNRFSHENLPDRIDPNALRETMDNVWAFLDGCCCGLSEALDYKLEYESECRREMEAYCDYYSE